MSVGYRPVQWNAFKLRYDAALAACILLYLLAFLLLGRSMRPPDRAVSDEILLIRAFGSAAFILLHLTLCIGPLSRFDSRFLPLLYNRRHLGVTTFVLGAIHAVLVVGYYHGFGRINPLESLLTSSAQYRSLSAFPFEILGLAALLILLMMAATSHDFWLKNLTPQVWKWLHMGVYLAWALLVLHVALGVLQTERSTLLAASVTTGVVVVGGLHIGAAQLERRPNRLARKPEIGPWIDVCAIDDLEPNRGRVVEFPGGVERVALFCHGDGRVSAVSNACAHQGGPLGEGRIVDGCITCPWHGYQYRPHDGCAPAPFTEKLATYSVRVEHGRVQVNKCPLAPGTPVEPARVHGPTRPGLPTARGEDRELGHA